MSAPPSGVLFYEARAKPLSTVGLIQPGAYYQFYLTQTLSLTNVYADGSLVTPLSQTPGSGGTTAASDGRLVPIYLNPATTYRYQLYSATNVLLEDVDPYIPVSVPTANQIGQVLYPQTPAEILASVTPSVSAYPEGDIRRYGATVASGNNSVPIQTAISVSANGGAAVYIPAGAWNITTTLVAAGNCSMVGEGATSGIVVNGCNGIDFPVFSTPPLLGRRIFQNFALRGVGTSTFRGITTSVSPGGVFGVTFQNLLISSFQYMIYMSGFRLCSFIGLIGRDNLNGLYMIGQNTNIEILGCSITTDVGGTNGVTCQILAGNSTQGVHIVSNYFFGYDIGISVPFVFDLMCVATDFANCNKIGADVTGGVMNCAFDNCIFETNSSGINVTKGAVIEPLSVTGNSQIWFTNCEFEEITHIAGSIGISIPGANNNGAILNGNEFFNHDNGIVNVAGTNTIMRDNRFFGITTTCVQVSNSCVDNIVGPIFVMSGSPTPLVIITSTPVGFQYYGRGSFTLSFTGMTGTVTGAANWVANGSTVTLSIPANITGTSAAGGAGTAMTATGIPNVLRPITTQAVLAPVQNNSVTVLGANFIDATGTITFSSGVGGGAFTSGGSKGLNAATIPYAYL